jgi:signal transduction histidine kinase
MVVELDPTELPETPLVRLVALYTGVIALALLVFAYFAMTRLVVQPIEAISRGASRIAGGINTFEIPASRTKEFGELSDSLQTMLARLMAKEALLLSKIAELERITRELRDAQESIVRAERLASVGRLAAGIAHEIGNPIAAILGFEELLLSGGLEREEERDFLQRMKKETDRVHRVLRDLLDFARTGQGSPDSANRIGESTEVASNVETVLALLRPQRKLQDLHIENAVPNDLPRVKLAGERLQQVLLNLLINASDAARRRIRIEAAAQGQRVQLIVEDDGAGVSEAIRERLFEPFATTKDVGEGTGLGLAVCRGIIERAQGSITLGPTGRLGGALFIVELPAST